MKARWLFTITLLAHMAPLCPRAWAADFTAPGLSTPMQAPAELELQSPVILTEAALPGDRVLFEVTAGVSNLGDAEWERIRVTAREEIDGVATEVPPSSSEYPDPAEPGGVVQPAGPLHVVVHGSELAAARAELLAGTPFNLLAETNGAVLIGSPETLVLDSPAILEEIPLAGGHHLIRFTAGVRNVASKTCSNITLHLDAALGSVAWRLPGRVAAGTGNLEPLGSLSELAPLLVTAPADGADAVRAAFLDGSGLVLSGAELWVYSHPPRSVDAETDSAWQWPGARMSDGRILLVFTNATPFLLSLSPGDLLVENGSVHTLARHIDDPTDPFDDTTRMLADLVPFLVDEVTVQSNEVHVIGNLRRLLEVVRSATLVGSPLDAYVRPVRDPYDPNPEKTHTAAEEARRREAARKIERENPLDGRLADLRGMVAIPWHFNEALISDRIRLSGELLIRQSGIRLEMKIRDFEVQRIVTGIDAGVVFNLLVECGEPEDTTDDPPDEKSKRLFEIDDIPPVTFNLGGVPVTVRPVFALDAGVEANIPTRLTLPLQSSITLGMRLGYDRALVGDGHDGFFYEPIAEFVPIRVSDPTVFDDLAATLGFWAQLDIGIEIGAGSGVVLHTGPSIGLRLQNEYTLAPLSDPWWSMDLGLDVIGAFNMDLDLLELATIQLVDTSASIHHFDILHKDAGGPLIPPTSLHAPHSDEADPPARARPRSAREVRWARLFQGRGNFQGFEDAFVLPVPGADGDFIAGGFNSWSMLARYSREGDLIWLLDTHPITAVRKAAPLPDGSFFTAGTDPANVLLAQFTADGVPLWTNALTSTPRIEVRQVAARTNSAGRPEFFLASNINHTTVRDSDPVLVKLDESGNVLWSRYYALANDDEVRDMTLSRDGHVLLCGFSDVDVGPPPVGSPDPENILKNALAGGLLMKVDSESGDVLWAHALPARWGMTLTRVAEAPDGTIYCGGTSSRTVLMDRPCSLFAKFTPEGELIDHVLIGEDPDWPDELVNAGSSPYDVVHGLVWTPEGVVACGQTGLGADVSGWVIGLTEELGVRFHSVFDGGAADPLLDIADTGDGLAVVGHARSPFHIPGQVGQMIPMLLKLPWEGILRFDPTTAMRSLFLQPRVFHSSAEDEFQITSTLSVPGAPEPLSFGNRHGTAPFHVTPLALESGNPAGFTVTRHSSPILYHLDEVPVPGIDDYEDWAAYHQVQGTPESDPDGDGLSNYLEGYFGRNPHRPETEPVLTIEPLSPTGSSHMLVHFRRAIHARAWSVGLETSTDLREWNPVTDDLIVTPLPDGMEQAAFLLQTGEPHRFFRPAVINPPEDGGTLR